MADWTQLPYDITVVVANRLTCFKDFLAFSGVCPAWRSVYIKKDWNSGPRIPWLMLSERRKSETRDFFSLDIKKLYELNLPEIQRKRCWGSSHGWLVITGLDRKVELFNPITRVQISLPSQFMFPKNKLSDMVLGWSRFIYKAVVIKRSFGSSKVGDEYLVMAIYGLENQLAFARPGYKSWVSVEAPSHASFRDVVYFQGRIFALCEMGGLVRCEIDGRNPPRAVCLTSPLINYNWRYWDQIYLVGSSSNLLMVMRHNFHVYRESYDDDTACFKICKFNFDTRGWTELEDLGDQALFIGHCYSMSLSASRIVNCNPNSIYFTADTLKWQWKDGFKRMERYIGVYNMANQSSGRLYSGVDCPSYYSCPLWVVPALS